MKKLFILISALAAFSFSAHAQNACVDAKPLVVSGIAESVILGKLKVASCDMTLQDAVCAIIAADGNKQNTLTAAMSYDSSFSYDPTACLQPTAAGLAGTTGAPTRNVAFNNTAAGAGGGGGNVSP